MADEVINFPRPPGRAATIEAPQSRAAAAAAAATPSSRAVVSILLALHGLSPMERHDALVAVARLSGVDLQSG